MFKKFRNMLNREGHKHCKCCKDSFVSNHPRHCEHIDAGMISLNDAPEDKRVTVKVNSDIKTMEMGLYPGSIVSIVHNNPQERNIIVKINDQRYVVPREIASKIYVK